MNEMTSVTDTATDQKPAKATPALPDAQTVTEVKHWTDRLFSFRCTRPASPGLFRVSRLRHRRRLLRLQNRRVRRTRRARHS